MSKDKNHSESFERYLKGEMSPKETNAFEREVLDDPFATEALEGFEDTDIEALNDLQKLRERVATKEQKGFPWLRIAASVALILTATWVVYLSLDQIDPESELAMEKESIEESTQPIVQDSLLSDHNESTTIAEEVITEDEIEQSEELIAKAIQKAKKDGTKVAKEETLVAEIIEAEQEEQPEVPLKREADLAIDDAAVDTIAPAEITDFDQALQGSVAGVEIVSDSFENVDSKALKIALNATPETSEPTQEAEARSAIRIRGIGSIPKKSEEGASYTVSGTVTDDTGEPLPGVNVLIKGTTTGTQTDLDGNYMLPKLENMVLIFSYVGFQSYEFEVGERTTLDVTMGGATELQEVVVTGYGGETEQETSYSSARPSVGNKAYKSYLEDNIRYPEAARENSIEGTVVLQLSIDPSGAISNIDIKRSLGYGCDEEAIRLVREGPKWIAAEKDGNRVGDKLRVKVKFKLD